MDLKFYLGDSREVTSFSLLDSDNGKTFDNLWNRKAREDIDGRFRYKCHSNSLYGVVSMDVNADNQYEVMSEFEGSAVVMAFMRTGLSSCVYNGVEGHMYARQNNIFLNDGIVKCRLKEANSLRILLSATYISKLAQLYPEVMSPLVSAMEQHRDFVLGPTHLPTTLEMELVIKSIEKLPSLEGGNEMFLEAKIRELLYMQICQYFNLLKQSEKFERYRGQMQSACEYIEDHMKETLSLHQIALAVGVCDTILKLAFKHFYGITVFAYLNEYRMCKACDILRNSSCTILDVAMSVGYEYLSHFSTVFKQRYGVTPVQYRNSLLL